MTTPAVESNPAKSCFAINIDAYESFREAVAKDPTQANFTFKTRTEWLGGARALTTARGFSIQTDEPSPLGGTDSAPDPVELLLTAASTCLQIGIVTQAARRGIALADVVVEAEGDLDVRGYLGDGDVRPGYQRIRYRVRVAGDAPADTLEELVRIAQRTSPMVDSVENGTPVIAEVTVDTKA